MAKRRYLRGCLRRAQVVGSSGRLLEQVSERLCSIPILSLAPEALVHKRASIKAKKQQQLLLQRQQQQQVDHTYEQLEEDERLIVSTCERVRELNNHAQEGKSKTKHFAMATVRPISPRNQETLDLAISLAKELASKSIADSGESSPKTPNSPDKRRFNFKFKPFSKSFSEASANIRDIESSISSQEKQAYNTLIGNGQFSYVSSSSSSSYSNQIHHHSYHNSHTFGRSGSRSSSGSSSSRGSSALHSPLHDPLLSSTSSSRPFASHTMAANTAHYANDDFSTSPTSISSFTSLSSKTFKRGCSSISAKRSFF